MGLISDYLEENRERLDGFDPCFPIGAYFRKRNCMESIKADLQEYDANQEVQRKKLIRQRLIAQLVDLERLIAGYLAGEKYILFVCNGGKLKSALVQEIFEQLREEMQKSYYGACELRQEILKKLESRIERQDSTEPVEIENEILGLVIKSVVMCMGQGGTLLNTAQCRNTVYDLGNLLISQGMMEERISPKKALADYLQAEGLAELGNKSCCNCGRPLYKTIRYCLNCYERN